MITPRHPACPTRLLSLRGVSRRRRPPTESGDKPRQGGVDVPLQSRDNSSSRLASWRGGIS